MLRCCAKGCDELGCFQSREIEDIYIYIYIYIYFHTYIKYVDRREIDRREMEREREREREREERGNRVRREDGCWLRTYECCGVNWTSQEPDLARLTVTGER
jgi:hypothetical protein